MAKIINWKHNLLILNLHQLFQFRVESLLFLGYMLWYIITTISEDIPAVGSSSNILERKDWIKYHTQLLSIWEMFFLSFSIWEIHKFITHYYSLSSSRLCYPFTVYMWRRAEFKTFRNRCQNYLPCLNSSTMTIRVETDTL